MDSGFNYRIGNSVMSGKEYPRISEDKYKHLLFSLRGQFGAILNVFRCYGLDPYVDDAIGECMRVSENFGMAVRGKDKPIHILGKPKSRATDGAYDDDKYEADQ